MSEWNNYSLGGVAEITSSKRIFYSEYVDSGIPFYRSKEVINLFKKEPVQTELFITQERFNEIESKFGVPKENDILLTSVGSLGIPYLVKASDKFYFKDGNLTWFRNIDKSLLDPKYLYIWLSSSIGKQKLDEVTIGSTQAALTISGLKTIEIELPPLPEQKAIASVLSSLDDKIDLLYRQNKTLEAMAETLFRQWFIEEAKEDWEEASLGSLFTISSGKGLKREQFRDHGLIPVLGANGEIGRTDQVMFEEFLIYTGRVGTLGKVSIIEGQPVWLSDNTLVFRDIEYFYFTYFQLKAVNYQEYNVGSTQPLIRQSDIKEIAVLLPSDLDMIKRFELQAKDIFGKIQTNTKQIQTLENLRNTLLPKLMSGEVRVQYQTEEVA